MKSFGITENFTWEQKGMAPLPPAPTDGVSQQGQGDSPAQIGVDDKVEGDRTTPQHLTPKQDDPLQPEGEPPETPPPGIDQPVEDKSPTPLSKPYPIGPEPEVIRVSDSDVTNPTRKATSEPESQPKPKRNKKLVRESPTSELPIPPKFLFGVVKYQEKHFLGEDLGVRVHLYFSGGRNLDSKRNLISPGTKKNVEIYQMRLKSHDFRWFFLLSLPS